MQKAEDKNQERSRISAWLFTMSRKAIVVIAMTKNPAQLSMETSPVKVHSKAVMHIATGKVNFPVPITVLMDFRYI